MELQIKEGGLLFKQDQCVGSIYKSQCPSDAYYFVEIDGRVMEMPFTNLDEGDTLFLHENRPGDSYLLGPIFTGVSGPK